MLAPYVMPDRAQVVAEKIIPIECSPESKNGTVVNIPGRSFFLHFAFDPAGRCREIGFSAKRESADLPDLLAFTCAAVSALLQIGMELSELRELRPDQFMTAILDSAVVAEREAMAATTEEA